MTPLWVFACLRKTKDIAPITSITANTFDNPLMPDFCACQNSCTYCTVAHGSDKINCCFLFSNHHIMRPQRLKFHFGIDAKFFILSLFPINSYRILTFYLLYNRIPYMSMKKHKTLQNSEILAIIDKGDGTLYVQYVRAD